MAPWLVDFPNLVCDADVGVPRVLIQMHTSLRHTYNEAMQNVFVFGLLSQHLRFSFPSILLFFSAISTAFHTP